MRTKSDVLAQLKAAGLNDYLIELGPCHREADGKLQISGRFRIGIVNVLNADPRFASGSLYWFHRRVGKKPKDWRSYKGTFGNGSMQLVIDRQTGWFEGDVDRYNFYQDLVGAAGHAFVEVLPPLVKSGVRWIAGLFKRRRKASAISPDGSPE